MRRLVSNADLLAGGLFVLLGTLFFVPSLQFDAGTANQMGPGYFPRLLSGMLIVLGVIQVFTSARRHALTAGDGAVRFHIRPPLFVLGGMAVFAASLERLGLLIAAILLVAISGVVAQDRRWAEVAMVAVALAMFSAVVFVKGLGVFIPLWPELP